MSTDRQFLIGHGLSGLVMLAGICARSRAGDAAFSIGLLAMFSNYIWTLYRVERGDD